MHRFWAFLGTWFPRTEEPALAHCAAAAKAAWEKAPFLGGKGAAQDVLHRADAPLEGMRFWILVCDAAVLRRARGPFPLRDFSGLEERPPVAYFAVLAVRGHAREGQPYRTGFQQERDQRSFFSHALYHQLRKSICRRFMMP